jgi:hypothetical protein
MESEVVFWDFFTLVIWVFLIIATFPQTNKAPLKGLLGSTVIGKRNLDKRIIFEC